MRGVKHLLRMNNINNGELVVLMENKGFKDLPEKFKAQRLSKLIKGEHIPKDVSYYQILAEIFKVNIIEILNCYHDNINIINYSYSELTNNRIDEIKGNIKSLNMRRYEEELKLEEIEKQFTKVEKAEEEYLQEESDDDFLSLI